MQFHGLFNLAGEHDDLLHARGVDDGFFDYGLQRNGLSAPVCDVGGDDNLGLCVLDAHVERLYPKPSEHHAVHGADAGACEHRDHLFGDKGHVDADPVALCDAQSLEALCEPADLLEEFLVGEDPLLPLLSPPDEGHLVPAVVVDVAVQAVCGDIELGVDEPLRIGIVPLEYPVPLPDPLEVVGLFFPEPLGICQELPVCSGIVFCPCVLLVGWIGDVRLLLP
ncbi:MAG: hypothetical protein A4E39_01408 [Methanoregulaceae archaeon PtaB.Bin152]|nr:MAG: hypothetical protein A4E39_01408 [Methanoregulaceae archaeon PtaB.Bin152]